VISITVVSVCGRLTPTYVELPSNALVKSMEIGVLLIDNAVNDVAVVEYISYEPPRSSRYAKSLNKNGNVTLSVSSGYKLRYVIFSGTPLLK